MKRFGIVLLTVFIVFFSNCQEAGHSTLGFTKPASIQDEPATVADLKITTLSTMLANQGIGEWGYSALVEIGENKILFDTGRRPETVLTNAEELGIDLSEVEDVFLSHNHGDHTGGLLTLREQLKKQNPKAISRIHVGKGIFSQRINFRNRMLELKAQLEADGVTFIVYDKAFELFPGVWITGPVERIHPEKNYGGKWKIATKDGDKIDTIPEDQSLIINTEKGLVMVAGCGHAGLINTLAYARSNITPKQVYAIIGGFHLVNATDKQLEWTAGHLKKFGVSKIIGAHCTGIHALYTLKNLLSLGRKDAVVGSIGDRFELENGITPGIIAG
jgi:7,8-dihydropterin-6-yl-methyl-4-(beta-D-ribofuranosyl)aminobenzene 5'-phosphate synthase